MMSTDQSYSMQARVPEQTQPARREDKEITLAGLNKWYEHNFEHLGWMVLCQDNTEKINGYKHSIEHLLVQLKAKKETVSNQDVKRDLDIMYNNTVTLRDHVADDFASESLAGGARKKKSSSKSSKKKSSSSQGKTKSKSKSKSKKHKKTSKWD
jgi:isocitrate dehydrogenase kinase/phosphatase